MVPVLLMDKLCFIYGLLPTFSPWEQASEYLGQVTSSGKGIGKN